MNIPKAVFQILLSCVFFTGSRNAIAAAPQIEWMRQLGSAGHESGNAVALNPLGGIYITGDTSGSLQGVNAGGSDAFIGSFDAAGNLQWITQHGTTMGEFVEGAAADGLGNAYISGGTAGALEVSSGDYDAFVSKFNSSGALQWTKQLGTAASDYSSGVTVTGSGDIFIAGGTGGNLGAPVAGFQDAFVSRLNAAGGVLWTEQSGTAGADTAHCLAVDGFGNVVISGPAAQDLPGSGFGDVFVTKFDSSGDELWSVDLGTTTGSENSQGVAIDGSGNIFVTGQTFSNLGGVHAGGGDGFLSKFDATGDLQWTKQFGTSSLDVPLAVSLDANGNAYISGWTEGNLSGVNAGGEDVFVVKYDTAGDLLWQKQFGTSGNEVSWGIAADEFGDLYITGYTSGDWDGVNSGGLDVFVAKLTQIPEPTSWSLIAFTLVALRRRAATIPCG